MNHELRIAVIHHDALAAIGLRQMLQEVMPVVRIDTFLSANDVPQSDVDKYIHYFASTNTVTGNLQFFTGRRGKTIVLSASSDDQPTFAGFHCLCTSVPEKKLVRSLLALEQSAHSQGRHLPPVPQTEHDKKLSAREIEVMSLIVKGFINKEIGNMLNISLATVVTHRRNIMDKLGLKSVSALTIYAVTRGYVDIGEI